MVFNLLTLIGCSGIRYVRFCLVSIIIVINSFNRPDTTIREYLLLLQNSLPESLKHPRTTYGLVSFSFVYIKRFTYKGNQEINIR